MPCLQVCTNVSIQGDKVALAKTLSDIVAEATKKPKDYVQVIIRDGVVMTFGGTDAATAFADLRCIGSISRGENKATSRRITDALVAAIEGLAPERVYISFQSAAGENWGYDGSTFG